MNSQKPRLVFLHGFCEDSSIWKHLDLSMYNVQFLDLPGFGTSKDIPFSDLSSMADFVFERINSLQLKEVFLIGHSMGGYVILELMKLNPDFVKGIGLVHSHPFEDDFERIKNRQKAIDFIKKNDSSLFLKHFYPSLFWEVNVENY